MTNDAKRTNYFTRGEILKLVRLSPRQIQYWDESGLLRPRRKTKRRRYYDFANLVEFRLIESLMREGFSVQKIRGFVLTMRKLMPRDEQILSRLRVHTDGRTLIFREKGAFFEMNGQGLLQIDLDRLYHQVRPSTRSSQEFSKPVGTREKGNMAARKSAMSVRQVRAAS